MAALPVPPERLRYWLAHPNENSGPGLIAVSVITLTLSIAFVALRFWSRHVTGARVGADDWTSVAAVVGIAIQFSLIWASIAVGGLGKHPPYLTRKEISTYQKINLPLAVMFSININLVKVSTVLLYHRIFIKKGFRLFCWVLIGVLAAFSISLVLAQIFSCNPIAKRWNPTLPGVCLVNQNLLGNVSFGLMLLTDVIILVMPMPMIWSLKINLRQKLALTGIIALGLFATITTIVRQIQVLRLDVLDAFYSVTSVFRWQTAELALIIIASCLITLRPLLPGKHSNWLRSRSWGYSNTSASHDHKNTANLSYIDPHAQQQDHLGHSSETRIHHDGKDKDLETGLPASAINVKTEVDLKTTNRG